MSVTERQHKKRLANTSLFYYNIKALGPLAQLGERKVRNLEVRGSIPLWSTNKKLQNSRKFWGFIFCVQFEKNQVTHKSVNFLSIQYKYHQL